MLSGMKSIKSWGRLVNYRGTPLRMPQRNKSLRGWVLAQPKQSPGVVKKYRIFIRLLEVALGMNPRNDWIINSKIKLY